MKRVCCYLMLILSFLPAFACNAGELISDEEPDLYSNTGGHGETGDDIMHDRPELQEQTGAAGGDIGDGRPNAQGQAGEPGIDTDYGQPGQGEQPGRSDEQSQSGQNSSDEQSSQHGQLGSDEQSQSGQSGSGGQSQSGQSGQPGVDGQSSGSGSDEQSSGPGSGERNTPQDTGEPPGEPGSDGQPSQWEPDYPGYHVTVNGSSSGDGSIERPWDLATGLSNDLIKPGDIVYIHAGTYKGAFNSQLYGAQNAPIHVRPWHNDAVIIDGGGYMVSNSATPGVLVFGGRYTWISGITITNSATNHYTDYANDKSYDGVHFIGPGNKLINCIIYGNSGNGIGFWNPAVNAEVSGCIIYHNGVIGPNRGHGHGLYVQQGTGGTKTIRSNIIFNSFGKGIQVYGTGVEIHNTIIEDNIFYDAALAAGALEQSVYIGGILRANNHIVRNNVFYASPGRSGTHASAKFGDTYGNTPPQSNGEAVFSGNYCVDSFLHITRRWERVTARDNTYIAKSGAERIVVGYDVFDYVAARDYDRNTYHRGMLGENSASGFALFPLSAVQAEPWLQELSSVYNDELPAQNALFVKPAGVGADAGRWHVAVFNWAGSRSVSVSIPGLATGAGYAVFYASGLQSGPIAHGRYNGSSITIPLSPAPTDIPRGMGTHASRFTGTLPEFGAFLVTGG